MRSIIVLSAAMLSLAACGIGAERIAFEGNYYRASASAPAKDRANFTAVAGPASQGAEGAAAAARHEAVRHCVRYLGTSVIDYAVPAGTPAGALPRDGDRVVLRGTCIEKG
ncbi:hypothetical protein SAMN05421759_102495 [Roseivivax lentus]|uniref:Lipoprotein n=1 Tax=Roseivivax lentus TaxID=633194 RepID=A0A1N7L9C4_9RHOB|nr:hypothetical protein [Roseivivax lentus]SIS70462.1 hypothetical protein SAMN05421759_102495 [Roseivivax lentus]